MPRTTHVNTPAERGQIAIMARLLSEDWSQMTSSANKSLNHPASLDRWRNKARQANPKLNDEQVDRLAERMRKAHYARMGKLSGEARRLARDAAEVVSEIESSDEVA